MVGATVYGSRPHAAAPAKAEMSRGVNRCHVKQLTNVTSSSDVALRPSEDKTREGYERSPQVIALFRQRQAALMNSLKCSYCCLLTYCLVSLSLQ